MLNLYLQNELNLNSVPTEQELAQWVQAALLKPYQQLEQVVRVVDEAEMQQFNKQFRNKDASTNILSFPSESYDFLDYECLGDLLVCPAVVEREAQQQGKPLNHHWAHLIVHGMLHLQGYDHIEEAEAQVMESLEIKILQAMGIANPYNDTRLNN